MMATPWVATVALLGLVLGLLSVLGGRGVRGRGRGGLGMGKTVALDNVVLTSRRLGLTGWPDPLVKSSLRRRSPSRDGGLLSSQLLMDS